MSRSVRWKSWFTADRLRAGSEALAFPVGLFLCSRLALWLIARLSLQLDPRLHRGPFVQNGLAGLEVFCKWDCGWYASIAQQGYSRPATTNFFPLLPLLGRLVHELTGLGIESALVVIAQAAGLLALIVLYRLFRELEGEEVARTALLLFTAFPFAFFHAAGYPESMMVLFTALAVRLSLQGRQGWAGLVLGVGGLARHLSLVAGGALLFQQLRARGGGPRALLHRDTLALLIPPLLVSLYFLYLWRTFGDPQLWWRVRQAEWGQGAWAGLVQWGQGDWGPKHALYVGASFLPGAGAVLLLRHRRWWTLAAFALPLMLVLWTVGLLGLGRYSAAVWPAFLPLGDWLARHPALRGPVVLGGALLQGMLVFLFVHSYDIN